MSTGRRVTHRPSAAIVVAAIAGAAVVTMTSARGQVRGPEADRQALTALENEWLTAVDSGTLERILARDFVHPVPSGRFLSKAEHIAWFTRHPEPPGLRNHFTRLDMRVYGDVGIVNGTVVAEDLNRREVSRTVFTDVFAYRDRRWQAINGQENAVWPAQPEAPSSAADASNRTEEATVADVTRFLHDYYRGFEREDSSRLSGGVTTDLDSYFVIPARGQGLMRYGAVALAAAFGNVLRQYHGHHPQMNVSDLVVVVRPAGTAVASYRLLFSLDGRLLNDALAVSELRREGGDWKIYRHFEAKRR